MEWRMRNNNQNTRPTNESERMLMWTYPFVTVILVDGWREKGRATMSLLSYSFSRCAHTTMFFFLLVSCVFISIFTLNVGVEKKSQVLLWFVFSIELPGTTDEQYVISLTMMTGKKTHRQTYKILISNRKQAAINIIVAHYRNALASGCWLSWLHCPNSFNANPRENVQFVRINGRWLIGQCETSSLIKRKLSFAKISAVCTNSGNREPILTSRE